MTSVGTGATSVCAASQTDSEWPGMIAPDNSESTLPREFRNRLHKMFERVEREFEREYQKICAENFTRKGWITISEPPNASLFPNSSIHFVLFLSAGEVGKI